MSGGVVVQDLVEQLSNIDRDNLYKTVEILKEDIFGKTEKVLSDNDGKIYIRKYVNNDAIRDWSELTNLSHPGLAQIYDYYFLADRQVVIQEYIKGVPLSNIIKLSGRMTANKALVMILQLCDIVVYLHSQKPYAIIHRDIKPENIIISENGLVKLIDFGVARRYKSDQVNDTMHFGTPGYAPPEQYGFGQTDERSDIYAIGMTLFHIFTGKPPERGRNISFFNEDVPETLQRIIIRATEFDPQNRYRTAEQMKEELQKVDIYQIDQRISGEGTPNSVKEQVKRFKGQNRIFPQYCRLHPIIKIILMPIHICLLAIVMIITLMGISSFIVSGQLNAIIEIAYLLSGFIFWIFPTYILLFNFFNLDQRVMFFQNNRILKKVVIIVALFLVGTVIVPLLNKT